MLPKNPRHFIYAFVLLIFSAIGTTAIANTKVHAIFSEVVSVLRDSPSLENKENIKTEPKLSGDAITKSKAAVNTAAPMFATIIQGADDEVECSVNGRTIARFILCGDSDNRNISLFGGPHNKVSWEILDGAPPNTNNECPNTDPSKYTIVSTDQTFPLDASTVPASTGAEYRVRVDNGPYFYFEVIKSTITQTFTKKNFVCNKPGEIEITGLPNNYQFRIRKGSGGFSPYQASSRFTSLNPGFYTVQTRLNIAGSVCEYLYDVIEIKQVNLNIAVTFTEPVCSGGSGSITATVSANVPGPYTYTLLDENGAEIAPTSPISSNTFTWDTVSEGTYAVKVSTPDCKEDIANGIPAPIQYNDTNGDPITVGTGLDPISAITDTNGMSFGCSTITSVDIDVTPSGGSGTYSYTVSDGGNSGGNFTGTTSYTVNTPGTYTFFITDNQGCTAEKSEYVAELSPPDITATAIAGTCTNGGGKIAFNITDAKGFNLEYRATNAAGDSFTSSSTIPVADGTYNIIEVRYSQGAFTCTLSLPPETVTSAGGLTGSANRTQDYTCSNGEGIITFGTPSGGSGSGYEYSLDNVTYRTGTIFNGLTPGTYIPYIKDDANCYQALAPITVSAPVPPTAINFAQDNLDCQAGTSRVTVDVQPASFSVVQYRILSSVPSTTLPPAQASNVFPDLDLDTNYQFEITGADGCTYTANFTTGGFISIRARVNSGGDLKVCPGAEDGSGTFFIDGFATDYDYVITGPAPLPGTFVPSGTTSDQEIALSALRAGTYEIRVTDTDTNCVSTISFDVVEAATPLNVTANVTDMNCQNSNIGRVQATGAGGFSGYKYELDWPAASGVGTQGPKPSRTFGNLTAEGTYTLRVIDSEGCTAETTFTLTAVITPDITFDSADYCYSATNRAKITVSSTAGTAALATHQYRINGGALQTPTTPGTFTFNNLVPGNYTIEVVDGNGCTDQTTSIRIPPQIQVSLSINSEIPCGGDGEMQITVSGGDISNLSATSYTIFKDGTSVDTGTLSSNSFIHAINFSDFGDYTVSVIDNNGCSITSEPLTFVQPTNIAATERIVGPSCGDANSGFVEVIPTVSSGIPPFEVVFAPAGELRANPLDPNIVPDPTPGTVYSYSTQTVYSGLAAGNYEYVVKDSRKCVTAVIPVRVDPDTVPAPDATLTPIDATCSTGPLSGGVIVNLATAGRPAYTVIVEDNFGNPLFTQNDVAPGDFPLTIEDASLETGDYQVIVLDSRGCRDIEPLTINSATLDITPLPQPTPTCDPAGTTLCVDITGGTAPLNYEIRLADPDPLVGWVTPNNPPSGHCFAGLLNGVSYVVEVRDVNTGCTYEEVITLPNGPGLAITLTVDNATCRNGDVALNYTISGIFTTPFEIEITNLDDGSIVYPSTVTSDTSFASDLVVPAGRYGISISDAGGCSDGDEATSSLNLPRVDIIDNQNGNCGIKGQLTVRGSGGTPFTTGSPYLYAFVPAGTQVDDDGTLTPSIPEDDFSDASTALLPGSAPPSTGIEYDIWVKDANDCSYKVTTAIIQENPALPAPTITVNNQCNTTTPVGGFIITVKMPGNIDTPTFTLNGVSQTPAYTSGTPTQATFNVGSIGPYPINIIDAKGCKADAVAEIYQVLSASGGFTSEPNCENPDGEITITADGGSGDFTYRLTGTDMFGTAIDITDPNSDGIFENIPPGDYEVLVTDNLVDDGFDNCTFIVDGIVRDAPISPVIESIDKSDMSCNSVADGSISVTMASDPDPTLNPRIKEFNLYASTLAAMPANLDTSARIVTNLSGTFIGLTQNTYVVEVVTDRNCFDRKEVTIVNPPIFGIEAIAGTLACNPNSNQYSTTEVIAKIANSGANIGNGGPYGYKIDPTDSYQTSPTFPIVDNGSDQTITIYAIDAKGCESSDTITILAPNEVTATITQVRVRNCENPERIRIDVTGTTDFSIVDQGNSVAPVASYTVFGATFVEIDLPLVAGEYRLQINDNDGCNYPLEPYIVDEPVLPVVNISQNEPVGCYNAIDGILYIEIVNLASLTGFSGIYEYTVYNAGDAGFSGGAFGSPVAGNSNGTIDMSTAGNPATINGLPTGNLRVVFREQDKTTTACNVYSNASFIDTPSAELQISSIDEIGTVGCSEDLGEIVVNTQGGWESAPYEYMLEYENPIGSGFAPHSNPDYADFVANGTNNRFTGLSSGNYQVTVRDSEGCTHIQEKFLDPVPVIRADALVTRELECPLGNDAVIVSVEPGTTTPGAIGGVAGAGYQYRLIRLNSNDKTDVDTNYSRSPQLEPNFQGTGGTGVISGGWYAVEVLSSMGCSYTTAPVEVIPPPAIIPVLIQTSVPACGNIATMMVRVNNPQGGTYEFRRTYPVGHPLYNDPSIPWNPVDEVDVNGLPVKTGISGTIGESYRYEVRKIGGSSTCQARKTNGITITNAEPLSLDPTSPTFDVSCAYEIDGRIEAIAKGGTGIYEFRIYDYDPDPSNPDGSKDAFAAESSPTYDNRPMQDFGTFENLDAGSYYISVISRLDCGVVQGPFIIDPAEPVIIATSATPATCFGEADGTITLNVTSGDSGLVKFAIEPNLSEFFTDPDNPLTYTFTDLKGDRTYTVLAQDAEGCPQTFDIFVPEPEKLAVTDIVTTPETCIYAADGTAQLTIAGGTPFVDPVTSEEYYKTRLFRPGSDGDEEFLRNDNLFFENLAVGVTYIVYVQDASLCETFVGVTVEIGVDLMAEPIVQYGCEGIFPNSTASVNIQDSSLLPKLLFALNPANPTDAITAMATTERTWGNLPKGDYTAYIYHENGCTNFVEFTIEGYEPLILNVQKTAPNELTAIANGGFGGYEYFFDDISNGDDGVLKIFESGTIDVRVVDQNGCVAVTSIPFEFTGMLEIPNFFTPNGDNENDFWSPKNREFYPDVQIIIYDRYGRVVAELDEVSEWDGLYDNKALPTGDYWYVINQNGKRDIRHVGHFTLYR